MKRLLLILIPTFVLSFAHASEKFKVGDILVTDKPEDCHGNSTLNNWLKLEEALKKTSDKALKKIYLDPTYQWEIIEKKSSTINGIETIEYSLINQANFFMLGSRKLRYKPNQFNNGGDWLPESTTYQPDSLHWQHITSIAAIVGWLAYTGYNYFLER